MRDNGGVAGWDRAMPMDFGELLFARDRSFDAQDVVTAEGLSDGDLHRLQQEMAALEGGQCGCCTPGSSAPWRRTAIGRRGRRCRDILIEAMI